MKTYNNSDEYPGNVGWLRRVITCGVFWHQSVGANAKVANNVQRIMTGTVANRQSQ